MEIGEEREDNRAAEITLNPVDGRFTMLMSQADKKGPFEVKAISCSLAAGMKSGEAEYEIIDNDDPSEINRIKMRVEASNGAVVISFFDQVPPGGMKSAVSRWEVMD